MKKILALILALAMLLSMSLCLISCGGDEGDGEPEEPTETKINYTVTVVDGDGNPVKNVEITFAVSGGMSIPFKTDATGKASYRTDKQLSASVTAIPSGYENDQLNTAISFDANGAATLTVNKLAPFVILVVDQDGAPISGVSVQMCAESGSCRIPKRTDEEGKGYYDYEEGVFHAQLTDLPEGYTVDDPAKYYDFVDGVATITLTKAE